MTVRVVSEFASGLAVLGTVSSQLMNLSAIPSIREIYLAKSTLLYPAFPFMISLVASFCGLTYAVITQQHVVMISTLISMSLNSTYLGFHLAFSKERQSIIRKTMLMAITELGLMALGPLSVCIAASEATCADFSTAWIGTICTLVYCIVYCGQLSTFREIIRTRNSAYISPWMTAGTLFCALVWTWYSVLVDDAFYLASSLIGDLSGCIQIALILKYPAIPADKATPGEPIPMKGEIVNSKNEATVDPTSQRTST